MSALLAVLSAVALTALPPRGIALETKAGVELQSLSGRQLGALRGQSRTSVPRSGKPRLIRWTPRFAQFSMWGG